MRNFKFLAILAALALSTLMLSCNNTEVLPEEYYGEDEVLNIEREITFEAGTRAGIINVSGSISASFSTVTERVISYTVSPEILEATGMTKQELDDYLRENMSEEDYNDFVFGSEEKPYTPPNDIDMGDYDMKTHAGCMEYCKDKYTTADGKKISGRGACKANCWVNTAKDLIVAAAKTLNPISWFV